MVEKVFDSLKKMQQKSVFVFGFNYTCQVDSMILYQSSFFFPPMKWIWGEIYSFFRVRVSNH